MTLHAVASPPQGRGGEGLAAIKLRVRTSYRLQLLISGCIYEVTSPRYALRCFATHVETRSPPTKYLHCTPIPIPVQGCEPAQARTGMARTDTRTACQNLNRMKHSRRWATHPRRKRPEWYASSAAPARQLDSPSGTQRALHVGTKVLRFKWQSTAATTSSNTSPTYMPRCGPATSGWRRAAC